MKLSELLIASKELISDPRRHTKGTYARKKDGTPCSPDDKDAVCFCSTGALRKVLRSHGMSGHDTLYVMATRALQDSLPRRTPAHWNMILYQDHATHQETMAVWDAAIERIKFAEERGFV